MKKTLLLALAICTTFLVKADDFGTKGHGGMSSSDSKLTVGISVGAAIPMGDFGNKTKDTVAADSNKYHGFASTGFHFNISASYIFAGPVGAMVMIGGNMCSFDSKTYESVYKYPSSETASGTSYYVGQYLVGPCLSIPAGSLHVNVHVLVGLVTASAPKITSTDGSFTDVQTTTSTSAFGYNAGLGIKYNFNDKMGLLVDVGYTGATETYTGYTDTQTFGGSSTTYTNNGHKSTMNLGIFTGTVGIAFNL